MSRFFCPKKFIKENIAHIPKEESHHIVDVMRLRKGDEVVLFDAEGREYFGYIEKASNKGVAVHVNDVKSIAKAKTNEIILVQAIPKKAKMDFIIEKATELGADKIIPITTERTIVELDANKRIEKVNRWRKISLESSKQCNRLDVPVINEIVNFEVALGMLLNIELKLIATLHEPAVLLSEILNRHTAKSLAIMIGPEGDFTPNEVEAALNIGALAVTFGKRILKSDTAALFALSIIGNKFNV